MTEHTPRNEETQSRPPGDHPVPAPQANPGPPTEAESQTDRGDRPKVVITSEDGVSMTDPSQDPTAGVPKPAKVMRIGRMIKQLLDEVKAAPLDEAARDHLADMHARSVTELKSGLSTELAAEIDRIVLPLSDQPSEAEIRIAHAQLVGWLEGLFHGIQTALMAQQMLAQDQLQSMRRALPPGVSPTGGRPRPTGGTEQDIGGTGQYL